MKAVSFWNLPGAWPGWKTRALGFGDGPFSRWPAVRPGSASRGPETEFSAGGQQASPGNAAGAGEAFHRTAALSGRWGQSRGFSGSEAHGGPSFHEPVSRRVACPASRRARGCVCSLPPSPASLLVVLGEVCAGVLRRLTGACPMHAALVRSSGESLTPSAWLSFPVPL